MTLKRPHNSVYKKIWKAHNGEIPFGHHIHHIDGNPWNNNIANLQCVTAWEHYLIHKNQGDKKAAALLLSQCIKGEFPTYGHILGTKEGVKLSRLKAGLIYIPENKRSKMRDKVEVILESDMTKYNKPDLLYVEKDFTFLYDAISKLRPKEQFIINNFFGIKCEKKKAREIAAALNTSRSNIGALVYRTKIKLKEIINEKTTI